MSLTRPTAKVVVQDAEVAQRTSICLHRRMNEESCGTFYLFLDMVRVSCQ